MAKSLTEMAQRRGRLPALVVASAVLLWYISTQVIGMLFDAVRYPAIVTTFGLGVGQNLLTDVPFALGVFIALWAIAPISHELALPYVLTRAGLAAACGAVLADIVGIFTSFVGAFTATGPLFGNSFSMPSFDGGRFLGDLFSTLTFFVPYLLGTLPVVMLATVLLWLWQREHPREHAVYGLIDEV